MDVFEGFNLK